VREKVSLAWLDHFKVKLMEERVSKEVIKMSPTFRLFALPSFLEGVASLMDFAGNFNTYNEDLSTEDANERAVISDWDAVYSDFQKAVDQLREEIKTP
jgi:hypothetical protein